MLSEPSPQIAFVRTLNPASLSRTRPCVQTVTADTSTKTHEKLISRSLTGTPHALTHIRGRRAHAGIKNVCTGRERPCRVLHQQIRSSLALTLRRLRDSSAALYGHLSQAHGMHQPLEFSPTQHQVCRHRHLQTPHCITPRSTPLQLSAAPDEASVASPSPARPLPTPWARMRAATCEPFPPACTAVTGSLCLHRQGVGGGGRVPCRACPTPHRARRLIPRTGWRRRRARRRLA